MAEVEIWIAPNSNAKVSEGGQLSVDPMFEWFLVETESRRPHARSVIQYATPEEARAEAEWVKANAHRAEIREIPAELRLRNPADPSH